MIAFILLGALMVFSVLAVELDNLTYSVIALAGAGITLGALFFTLGALYVSVFQILIYGGAITILFFSLINLTEERERPKPLSLKIKGIEVPGLLLLIASFCLFLAIAPRPAFEIAPLAPPATQQLSVWIWGYRLTDTLMQAFILFSALVGVLIIWWSR